MDDTNKKKSDFELENEQERVWEESEIGEIEEHIGDSLKVLKSKLKESEGARAKLMEDLQRARADFLNSRRRIEEQSVRDVERVTNNFLIDLLPLLDSFDTALSHKESIEKLDPVWQKGIEGIRSLLTNFLNRYNVTEISTKGSHFNPHEHEALTSVLVADDKLVDTIVEVLQKGYKRNDTVLRPAKVTVGALSDIINQ